MPNKQQNVKIKNCDFEYQCPKSWEDLFETNVDSVRYCDQCKKNVYLSQSVIEVHQHAEKHECVAIPIDLTDKSRDALDARAMVGG